MSDEPNQLSKEIPINLTGNDSVSLNNIYEFGTNVSLVCVD